MLRLKETNVEYLICANGDEIHLDDGQFFCRMPKSWEIWQEEPIARIARIPLKRVCWVIQKEASHA